MAQKGNTLNQPSSALDRFRCVILPEWGQFGEHAAIVISLAMMLLSVVLSAPKFITAKVRSRGKEEELHFEVPISARKSIYFQVCEPPK